MELNSVIAFLLKYAKVVVVYFLLEACIYVVVLTCISAQTCTCTIFTGSIYDACTLFLCGGLYGADCIGSAFNMKGLMQCPNCRKVEKGEWLYSNGSSRTLPEVSMEDWIPDEDFYDLSYAEVVSNFLYLVHHLRHLLLCFALYRGFLLTWKVFDYFVDNFISSNLNCEI